MNINKFKGVIFDLDGTLFDSMGIWKEVDIAFFKNHGMRMPSDYQDKIKDMHFRTMAIYTKERFHMRSSIESIMDEWCELCYDKYANDVPLKKGVKEFLDLLKENNIKIAFATANTTELSEVCLKNNGIFEYFDTGAYLHETLTDKSDPDVYFLACERLGLSPEECIVFEDLLAGIKGAVKGGFTVCGVYDKHSRRDTENIKRIADYYIKSFEELL
ncbi:MAG: HAD family phosphatase [Clostridia bacterium]|nr:HAD family phosphatase [Clostridia bacterium]MBR2953992.1 HAD family phosphatase [Clostridia bacterium]